MSACSEKNEQPSRGRGQDERTSSQSAEHGRRVVRRRPAGGAVESAPGKLLSGEFLSGSVTPVWETEARRDKLSVVQPARRSQNQRAPEPLVVTDGPDGRISL